MRGAAGAALASLLVAGCAAPSPLECSTGLLSPLDDGGSAVLFTGSARTAGLLAKRIRDCSGLKSARAETRVEGPDGFALDHTAGPVQLDRESGTLRVDVTFTPKLPGEHRVVARFEPNLGATDRLLYALEDHRRDVPRTVYLPAVCMQSWPLEGAQTLCLLGLGQLERHPGDGGAPVLLETGVLDVLFDSGQLWALKPLSLVRSRPDGSARLETGICAGVMGSSNFPVRLLGASDGGVYVACREELLHVDGRSGLLIDGREGMTKSEDCTAPRDDGTMLCAGSAGELCHGRFGAFAATRVCAGLGRRFVGTQGAGVFSVGGAGEVLYSEGARDGGLGIVDVAHTLSLSRQGIAELPPGNGALLVFLSEHDPQLSLAPRFTGTQLLFEAWPAQENFVEVRAGWLRAFDAPAGLHRFYAR